MPDQDQEPVGPADEPTPDSTLVPPPLPTEIRPAVDAAETTTVTISAPAPEPEPTVFTGPPMGAVDPTVAVPPIVPPPAFAAEPEAPEGDDGDAESEATDSGADGLPLVDRTERDTASVVLAGLGVLLTLGGLGAAWWALTPSRQPTIARSDLPPPSDVWDALRDLVGTDLFWDDVLASTARLLAALVVGGLVGHVLGRWFAASPRLGRFLAVPVGMLRLLVPISVVPLLLVWTVVDSVVWTWLPGALALVGMLAAGTRMAFADQRADRGVNPGARSVMLLRLGVPLVWAVQLLTEALLVTNGIGRRLIDHGIVGNLSEAFVLVGVAVLLALVIDVLLQILQYRLRPERRADVPATLR